MCNIDISVIVPIWGAENYIERCLRSLFTQTKTDGVEFILVNDCTPDRSMDIVHRVIRDYPLLVVKLFNNKTNKHIGETIQVGLDNAVGDYIIQIDNDDYCGLTMLEDLYNKAIETDADMVHCDYFVNGKVIKDVDYNNGFGVIRDWLGLSSAATPVLWNKLIRRTLFTENDIKINRGGLYIGVDFYTSIRVLFFSKNIVYLPTAYVHYTIDNPLQETKHEDKYHYDERVKFITVVEEFYEENNCKSFDNDILRLKAGSKIKWLWHRGNSVRKQKECIKYFPEADRYILTTNRYSWSIKFPYYLAIHGCVALSHNIKLSFTLWKKIKFNIRRFLHTK